MPSDISLGTRIRIFADACLIYRPIYGINDQLTLQREIDKLMDWADRWGMYFNASKYNVMRMLGGIHSERFYHIEGPDPEGSTASKIPLRHPIPWPSIWRSHIDSVIAKANQKLRFVKCNLWGAPLLSKMTAYYAIVHADMEYATPIWDPYLRMDIDTLEKVQRKAAWWVKSQYSYNVSITSLLTELKWAPLAERRRITKLCLLHKIHTGAVNLNFKRDFNINYSTRTTPTGSWINHEGQLVNHQLHLPPN